MRMEIPCQRPRTLSAQGSLALTGKHLSCLTRPRNIVKQLDIFLVLTTVDHIIDILPDQRGRWRLLDLFDVMAL